jgi:hypothetical protein
MALEERDGELGKVCRACNAGKGTRNEDFRGGCGGEGGGVLR